MNFIIEVVLADRFHCIKQSFHEWGFLSLSEGSRETVLLLSLLFPELLLLILALQILEVYG